MKMPFDPESTRQYHHYSIGQLSRLLDIPAPTIRFYEAQGVVLPSRREDSRYRTYTTVDGNWLMRLKEFRNAGLSLKDAAATLNGAGLSELRTRYGEMQENLEREIVLAGLRMQGVAYRLDRLERLAAGDCGPRLEDSPALWRFNYQVDDRFEESGDHDRLRGSLSDALPATVLSFRIPRSELVHGSRKSVIYWGFSASDEIAAAIGLDRSFLAEHLPPQESVYLLFAVKEQVFVRPAHFAPALQFAAAQGYALAGDAVGHLLAVTTGAEDEKLRYYEVWLPVRQA